MAPLRVCRGAQFPPRCHGNRAILRHCPRALISQARGPGREPIGLLPGVTSLARGHGLSGCETRGGAHQPPYVISVPESTESTRDTWRCRQECMKIWVCVNNIVSMSNDESMRGELWDRVWDLFGGFADWAQLLYIYMEKQDGYWWINVLQAAVWFSTTDSAKAERRRVAVQVLKWMKGGGDLSLLTNISVKQK